MQFMSQSFLRRKKKKQENLLNDRRQNLLIYERGKDFFLELLSRSFLEIVFYRKIFEENCNLK